MIDYNHISWLSITYYIVVRNHLLTFLRIRYSQFLFVSFCIFVSVPLGHATDLEHTTRRSEVFDGHDHETENFNISVSCPR